MEPIEKISTIKVRERGMKKLLGKIKNIIRRYSILLTIVRGIQRIYYHFLIAIGIPIKEKYELSFWQNLKKKERNLENSHYKYFYMKHFNLDESFYKNKRILDIGCGPCGSLEWADMALERVGLDPLVESYRGLGINNHKMSYVCARAENIPFEDGYFDIVTSFNSLDHVDNLDQAINEIVRVLTPSGTFLLLTEVNHPPTPCEPIEFSYDIEKKFIQKDMKLIGANHYEKFKEGIYESILANIPYDHHNKTKRCGFLSAIFIKCVKEKKR